MTDEKDIARRTVAALVQVSESHRLDISVLARTIADMSPTAADAMKSAAESQYAKPALYRMWEVWALVALLGAVLVGALFKLTGDQFVDAIKWIAAPVGGAIGVKLGIEAWKKPPT